MQSSTRGLGLGIDTGGTYTDAAIVDLKDKRVLAKAKARTTHHDLAIGVAEAADNVMRGSGLRTSDISLVGVSTTLATNSILEGAGGRVGLIGIGWTPEEGWDLGADRSVFISGGHTVKGEESSPLLMDEVLDAVEEMSEGVDAVAISSIFSVYNREHEEKVAEALTESVPLPLVLGHHLTTDLGIRERTVTAVLNARLIPLINLFLDKVESSLRERGMRAPIMVFKGDGTLMNIHTARKRPVETILSGPAASSMGGRILAGVDSCIIVDIGGTSTDIAFLEDGFPKVTREGATVGKWRTRVRAVDMWTAALGGDSEVLPGEGKVSLGSRRVIPLSMAATRWPELLDRMRGSGDISYYVAFSSEEKDLVEGEGSVFRFLLENGPATSREVQRGTGVVLVDRQLRSLAGGNMVAGIGLTPTDCLHVNGTYTQGSVEAARLGVETASRSTGLSAGEMVDEVLNRVAAGISEEIIKKVMLDEGSSPSASGGCGYLMDTATGKRRPGMLRFQVRLDRPVVGIGAPAHVYLPMVQDRLGTEVIVPEEHDVGNAVGAVCSQISESVELMVMPRDNRFVLMSPFCDSIVYESRDRAVRGAMKLAATQVRERAERAGAREVRVKVETEERSIQRGPVTGSDPSNWIEVRATAIGRPTIV